MNAASAPHFNDQRWLRLTQDIEQALNERACPASDCVVLVPYAQLMGTARQAWVTLASQNSDAAVLLPRVETTQNWAASLWAAQGGFRYARTIPPYHKNFSPILSWRYFCRRTGASTPYS